MRLLIALVIASLSLTACASAAKPRPKSHYSKYGVQNEAPRYGDWFVEPNRCTVEAANNDLALVTNGRLTSTGLLPFKLTYNKSLVAPSTATLTGILVPIPQDGTGKNYTIYLDYSARSLSEMLSDGTFLTIKYQPLNEPQPLEAYFQTHGLVQAISELVRLCGR